MEDGVIVYPSVRESAKQIATETDEVWTERQRKPKNFAQNGVWKILWEARKKFLTNGSECARMHQVGKRFDKGFRKISKRFEKSS